jgi:hypothetical protein
MVRKSERRPKCWGFGTWDAATDEVLARNAGLWAGPEAVLLPGSHVKLEAFDFSDTTGTKVMFDGAAMRITNAEGANRYLVREYREGWGL